MHSWCIPAMPNRNHFLRQPIKCVFLLEIEKLCWLLTQKSSKNIASFKRLFENAIWTFFNLIKVYWILWQSIGAYSKVILKTLIVSCHLMVEWQTFDQIVVNAVVKPYRMEKYWFEDTNILKFQKLIWWSLAKIFLKLWCPIITLLI